MIISTIRPMHPTPTVGEFERGNVRTHLIFSLLSQSLRKKTALKCIQKVPRYNFQGQTHRYILEIKNR